MARGLDLSAEELDRALRVVSEAIRGWSERIASLDPAGTAHDPASQGVRTDWRPPFAPGPPPEEGEDLGELVRRVVADFAPDAQVVGHPGFLGYAAGAGNLVSALGQALAMALNPYTGTMSTAPAFVRIEDEVIRWFCAITGYPPEAGGILTSGSSLAILSAVIAARERARAPWEKARCYASDQAHHAVGKALFAAGFRPENLVVLASRDGRMDSVALAERVRRDRAAGLVPVLVVGTAGTTNAGRVDPLGAIADVCEESGAWFHCDAAYGGFFRLLPEIGALRGMERADSISLDPHKSFSMPYGTGALLARRVADLRFPRGLDASYMPPVRDEDLRYEYGEISPELSRDFRGLRVWLAIRAFGLGAFRENLRAKRRQALWLAEEIRRKSRLELVTEPDLSILTFRVRDDPDGAATRALLARINSGGRFFLTSAVLGGRFVIRVCLLGFRTTDELLEEFGDVVNL
ncbi:MAG: pyridoxal-dependent decarboxylase [Planctomycetes bacterium]|jgi:aromatic-L-amino-acid decarboxylase|nr:pyridoxal-dependent decarboxylase [Planctomycetota bacterium]